MKPRRTIWIWGLFAALMLVLLPNLLDIKWQNMLFRREAGFTRHFADSTLLPWRLVGRLTARSSICTASLIAPDLLLSAAHCVINARTLQPIAPAQIAFQPSFGGRAIYAKAVYFDRSWLYASDRTQLQFDWAVIHLQQPVGRIGPASGLEIARTIPKLPAEVSQAGYGFNRGQLYLDEACRIHRIERHQGA
ncbi:MAG: trypsin-like serine protease, partial [Pseudomonadota bacterium]